MRASVLNEGRTAKHPTAHYAAPRRAETRGVGPRELYGLFRRHKALMSMLAVAGTLVSAAAAYFIPQSFTASSMIVLAPEDPNLLEDRSDQTAQPANQFKTKMDTETDLMQSRGFTGRVVDELNLIADPTFNTYLTPFAISDGGAPTVFPAQVLQSASAVLTNAWAALPEHRVPLPPSSVQRDRAISMFLMRLSITRKGESLAMTVSVSGHEPERTATLANAVTRLYVSWSRDQKRDTARGAVEFLRQQAGELAVRISNLEGEIASYSGMENVSSDPRDDLLRAALQQANEQLGAAREEMTKAQSRLAEVNLLHVEASAVGNDPLPASPFLTTLRSEEAVALKDQAQLAGNFGANHPLIRANEARVASVRAQISQEMRRIVSILENDVRVAQGRIARIEAEIDAASQRLRHRSHAEIRLRELDRDLLTEQKLYDVVSARLGKLDPYSEIAEPGARVVSLAEVPSSPSSPDPRVVIGSGFAGSLVVAFIAAMTLEGMDNRVRDPKRVAEILDAPILAFVPYFPCRLWGGSTKILRYLCKHPNSAIAERYRSVYNLIQRRNPGVREQVIMVTSGLPREGKTTTALGLAVTAALEGSWTVLVDLDLRTGGLRRAMGLPRDTTSLEAYLRTHAELRDVIHTVPGLTGLDVIVSAAIGDRVSGHVNAEHLARLFEELRATYDVVIVDTPPLMIVDDAAVLSVLADCVVLTAALPLGTEDELCDIGEQLRTTGMRVAGIVINEVDGTSGNGASPSRRVRLRDAKSYFGG
ncbi:chain-length determining protein [Aureimonas sp. SA4125]|uniref:GumC family protein n=1 Tax=Aureimonas sp. SA4125 TaxID=2826993 RepID=UPI001CC6463D|nr:Wzz/FepE/Etk N-terminal domain-containing protein [Aureimonas sp. SA4125]BDA82963.1 chain-length determining protein [Aureimonas sp. SA4125]